MYDGLRVAAIAAVADNGVIGVQGDLPWHLPDDLRWFKRVTKGHAIIMGRKTWQTLPKPLPHRLNIILSRTPDAVQGRAHPRVCVVATLAEALAAAAVWERKHAETAAETGTAAEPGAAAEIMVVGGGGIYAALWPWVDRFYRTRVAVSPPGDAHFPAVDLSDFALISTQAGISEPDHVFEVLERRSQH